MSLLAAYLRDRARDAVRHMTPDARIRLALSLGDDDLRLFCAASGQSPERARHRLSAARQIGRRTSVSAATPER